MDFEGKLSNQLSGIWWSSFSHGLVKCLSTATLSGISLPIEDTYLIHWWHWLLYTLTSDLSSRASTCLSYHCQAETLILLKMTYHNPLLFSSLYILDFPSYFSWHKVLYPFLILHHTFTCLLNSFWKSDLAGQKKPCTNKTILISS